MKSISIFIQPLCTLILQLSTTFAATFTLAQQVILNLIYFPALSNFISTQVVRKDFTHILWFSSYYSAMAFTVIICLRPQKKPLERRI